MLRTAFGIGFFICLALPTLADDWVASRLRGNAEMLVQGEWIPLVRGMVVLDGQQVRTGANGRAEFVRGAEMIELLPGSLIELHEGAGNTTSVELGSGTIVAKVERRNIQHFSVQTPYLAAVVKGTRFLVAIEGGGARVEVDRGVVQVQDTLNNLVVDVVRGQEAEVSPSQPLQVSGPGAVAVFTFQGERVVNGTSDIPADSHGHPAGGSANHGNASSNNNGNGGNGNENSGNDNGNGGESGNGNSGNDNANGGWNGNANSGNGNGGGNGNANSGNGDGDGGGNGNVNSGNDNANGGWNGNANSGNGNGGGNGNANSGNGDGDGGGNGNTGTR